MSRLATPTLLLALLAATVTSGALPCCRVPTVHGEEPAAPSSFSAADLEFFEKEVRPILVERCFECHRGSGEKSHGEPKGGLRVDSRQALLAGGDTGPAIVPGKPQESLLIDAINYGDTYQMPPKTRMPASEVAVLTHWVERGAPWPPEEQIAAVKAESFDLKGRQSAHWCWQPVQTPPLPAVRDASWPQQPLDRFILARLEAEGLSPAPPAERTTLLRRLTFDLLGLPPTPEQAAVFLADDSPQAVEKLVDQLLESPHFGERWARHWMDLVRYAETCGHEFDYPIHHAWRYRDYLVRAFNADLPYDQFIVEQIAGDLLPHPRLHPQDQFNESVIGTGFWWLHEAIHAPVDVRLDAAGRIDNQIDTFSKTFLGLTVACARCHDHKFDAISTQDYYSLAGFLRSTRRQEALLDPGGRIHDAAVRIEQERSQVSQRLQQWVAANRTLTGETFGRYLLAIREVLFGTPGEGEPAPVAGHRRDVTAVAKQFGLPPEQLPKWVTAWSDPERTRPDHPLAIWAQAAGQAPDSFRTPAAWSAWREEWHRQRAACDARRNADRELVRFGKDPGSFSGWTATGEAFGRTPTGIAEWNRVASRPQFVEPGVAHSGQRTGEFLGVLRSPTFTIDSDNIYYRITGEGCEVRLIIDGYTMIEFHQLLFGGCKFPVKTDGQWTWHRQAGDLQMYRGHRAYIELVDHGGGWTALEQVVFSDSEHPPEEPPHAWSEQVAGDLTLDSPEKLAAEYGRYWESLQQRWTRGTPDAADVAVVNWLIRHELLGEGEASLKDFVAAARTRIEQWTKEAPAPLRVTAALDGTGEDERIFIRGNPRTLGPVAPRQLLTALVGPQPPVTDGSGRLTLARQIADPANPLTARVLVNRTWHHLFGVGLVPSTDNFGVLGETPTHPELLDYLAQQFVTEGWSLKRLIRSLVLSRTYQMSSAPRSEAEERDPRNRLWHRTNIRRLEGEAIRDAMLAVSGRLDPTPFGPSVPVHITPFMQGRGKPGQSGPLDGNGRRSLYLEVRRNFLSPMMLAFDTPIPFNTVGRRNQSNVPAQALILMNDPFVLEQAQRWSQRLLAGGGSWEERVQRAYREAFARPPTEAEQAAVREFFATHAGPLAIPPEQIEDDPRLWTDLCHVLFNVKEFVFLQ